MFSLNYISIFALLLVCCQLGADGASTGNGTDDTTAGTTAKGNGAGGAAGTTAKGNGTDGAAGTTAKTNVATTATPATELVKIVIQVPDGTDVESAAYKAQLETKLLAAYLESIKATRKRRKRSAEKDYKVTITDIRKDGTKLTVTFTITSTSSNKPIQASKVVESLAKLSKEQWKDKMGAEVLESPVAVNPGGNASPDNKGSAVVLGITMTTLLLGRRIGLLA